MANKPNMLSGVEAARRRRFHQTTILGCSQSSQNTSIRSQLHPMFDDSRLGPEAMEAKKRLDKRLQAPWKSQTRSCTYFKKITKFLDQLLELKLNKRGTGNMNWLKLSWKSSGQDKCSVCLDQLKVSRGRKLMQLPCAHKFHTNCVVPWLEGNSHCPCCRMDVPS